MILGWVHRKNLAFSSAKHTLAIVRHGESIWNKQKKWAGWTDVPLSSFGIKEVKQCAKTLKTKGINFDVVYTSVLSRAIKSTNIILDQLELHYLPIHKDWRLNEKHYGSLQGCSKVEINQKHGQKTVTEWRRSMTVPPPPLDKDHETHPSKNPIYKFVDPQLLPSSESLSDIVKRLKPFWDQKISKDIRDGKNVLVVAHGSSLRALISLLKPNMSEDQIKNFNIPNAIPIIFGLDQSLHAISMEYVGDQHQIDAKMNKIKNQTKRTEIH